jgi:hypothetical protein
MTTDISLDGLRYVPRRRFFKSIGGCNIYISTTEIYPYTRVFKTGDGKIVGKIVNTYVGKNRWPVVRRYYIADYKDDA